MNEVRIFHSRDAYTTHSTYDDNSFYEERPSGYFGAYRSTPQEIWERRIQFADNFSLFSGNHTFKFGIDWSYIKLGGYVQYLIPGNYVFLTDAPFDPNNPATYPFMLLRARKIADVDSPYWEGGVFAQDSWKVTPKLTLNYGVRWNYYTIQFCNMENFNIRHFNPRFGFSYDPIGDGKTAIRGGIGTYSQNPQMNMGLEIGIIEQLFVDVIIFPGYPDPSIPNPFVPPMTVPVQMEEYGTEASMQAPYTLQTTLGIQREVIPNLSASIDLIWARGYKFSRKENDNPVIPGTGYLRPDPTKSNFWVYRMNGKSDYKAVYFTVSKRYSSGWSLDVAYTLSRSWTDVETEQTRVYEYGPDGWERMYGPSDFDATHRLAITGIVDLPLGFQLSGLAYYRSALPFTAFYLTDVNRDSLNTDIVDDHRNARRGYDQFYVNLRFSKYIQIDRFRIQLIAEAYNVTNRVNWLNPYPRYDTQDFGNPTAADSPRRIQFGARFDF